MPANKSETKFKDEVKEFLRENGCYAFKYWGGNKYTVKGIPDLIACIDGVFHGIELKTDVGVVAKLQAYNIDSILNADGEAYVLRPTRTLKNIHPEYDVPELTFEQWKNKYFKGVM
ncbi:VRR-NUC domain-containing protein [Listeria booriae]|uniref:VRR-NUC domain-containing protein n=1 Tax=Listeria booriae TaxID=1552123 RepID=UPI0021ADEB7D|nr:VRR-NUC domain-containing protein [Listeria booriae]